MAPTLRLLRTLGTGATGAVHLAELHGEDDFVQTLAVKRLHAGLGDDREWAARLRDEARLLALLQHDAIVRVHGLTRFEGRLAILMEPVTGLDLGRCTSDAPLPARVALEVAERIADALDAAWNTVPPGATAPLRVVHRDIKPSNVMLTPRGGVKVMDFGVARAHFDAREVQTRSQNYGTARYMAPERWLEGVAEHRSDVYSLGITLIELLTGSPIDRPRLSRQGFDEDVGAALAALEPELRSVVAPLVRFDPNQRPSAAEAVGTLREVTPGFEGPTLRSWAPAHVIPRTGEALDATGTVAVLQQDPSTSSVAAAPAPPAPRRWIAWALLAALPVAAGLVWVVTPEPPGPPQPSAGVELEPELVPPPDEPTVPRPAPVVMVPPAPAVTPVKPDPAPVPAPPAPPADPAPDDPVGEAEPEAPPDTTSIQVRVDRGLKVWAEGHGGLSGPRPVLQVPESTGTVVLTIEEDGEASWTCTILADPTRPVRVQGGDHRGCTQ